MKIAPFWAPLALLIPAVLTESTATSATSTTSTAASPSCTASLITELCGYPEPGPEFAVASSGRAHCWDYCNAHPPCAFVIFAEGNPYLGTGTCWLYPGETFDESQGDSDCANPYLDVYSQPECAGSSATATATTVDDACAAATATPSAIASVCGYPTPDDDCWSSCSASSGASDCLSQCAEADSCSYVVFNPHNPSNSPYADGTCWMYPNGTYDAGAAAECSGEPEQWVYENACPKPASSLSSSSVPPSATSTGGRSSSTGEAGNTTTGSVTSAAMEDATTDENSASARLSLVSPLVLGVAILLLQAL